MAPPTPASEPTVAVAGDSWLWTQTFSDYPASEGWAISYTFRGVGSLDTATSEVSYSGSTATVTIPASRTALVPSGLYQWHAYATGSGTYAGRRHKVSSGVTDVTANLAQLGDGDAQSQNEKDLAAIRAVRAGKITDDIQSYQIAGRQVVSYSLDEIRREEARLSRAVWRERNPGKAFTEHLAVLA